MFDMELARKKFSLFKNLKIAFIDIKYLGLKYYVYLFINIFCEVVIPFLIVLIPTIIVDELQTNFIFTDIISKICLTLAFMFLLNLARAFTAQKMERLATLIATVRYWSKLNLYLLSCSLSQIEDDEERNTLKGVTRSLYSGDGTGQYAGVIGLYMFGIALIVNSLGFLLYASIASNLSIILLIVLCFTSFINCYIQSKAILYDFQHIDKFWQNNGRFWYLKNEARDLRKAKDIRMYDLKKWFSKSLDENLKESVVIYKDIHSKYMYANYVVAFSSIVRDLFAYIFLIWQLKDGSINVASFILYIGVVAGFNTWVSKIFESYSYLKKISNALSVFRSFLDENNTRDTRKAIVFETCESIEFSHCDFSYGKQIVFKDYSLKIRKHEKVALVGVNGAGKTTLVKMLCGLYPLNGGSILVNDQDINEIQRDAYYLNFSVLFQDIQVLPFSILENITCSQEQSFDSSKNDILMKAFHKANLKEAENIHIDRNRAIDCLKKAGLWEKIESLPKGMDTMISKTLDKDGIELSGGETQRLLLARALYKDAPILILDEPTSALDPISESELYEKYANLCDGKTSIFISHRLSSTRFCDRILFLENGNVIEEGTHDELMDLNGQYASMYQIQSHYYQKEELKDEAGI